MIGMSMIGMSMNGMSMNGMSMNGLWGFRYPVGIPYSGTLRVLSTTGIESNTWKNMKY